MYELNNPGLLQEEGWEAETSVRSQGEGGAEGGGEEEEDWTKNGSDRWEKR